MTAASTTSSPRPEDLLDGLLAAWEGEVLECKHAENSYDLDKLGKYFSALSNEASLRGIQSAWMLLGIDDRSRSVVGTRAFSRPGQLNDLKQKIAEHSSTKGTFRDIHEVLHPDGRVLMLEIPAAPRGQAVAWKGHAYGRSGESLGALPLDKLDELRGHDPRGDWTAQTVPDATIADLDPAALAAAREGFSSQHSIPREEIDGWSDDEFLARAHLTQQGKLTRSALLLLGAPSSAGLLTGVSVQISWVLDAEERAYEHFGPPFLLNTTKAYERIRNFQVRMLQPGTLIQTEVPKYDRDAVLEAIHNCVAHADWASGARIALREHSDRIVLENAGSFIEGASVEDYVIGQRMPSRYRNPHLVGAMVALNMIDSIGYGLRRIHDSQRKRFLPLPDYEFPRDNEVRTTIYSRVIDQNYSEQLMAHTDLDLADVLALDRVQKKLPLDDTTTRRLRRQGLIDGRRPHLHVSAQIAVATNTVADYVRTRSQSDEHYIKLITDYLRTAGSASRRELDDLLFPLLSDALSAEQKRNKVHNLLAKLRRAKTVENAGTRRNSRWTLL